MPPEVVAAYVVTLHGYVPHRDLTPNARAHWAARYRATEVAYRIVWGAMLDHHWPRQQDDAPPWLLTITVYRQRLLDEDSAYAAVKPLVDQLKRWIRFTQHDASGNVTAYARPGSGVLVDDSPKYLSLIVRQVKAPRAEQRTEMELQVPPPELEGSR